MIVFDKSRPETKYPQFILFKSYYLCTSLFFQQVADWAFGTLSMKFTSSSISSLIEKQCERFCTIFVFLFNKCVFLPADLQRGLSGIHCPREACVFSDVG